MSGFPLCPNFKELLTDDVTIVLDLDQLAYISAAGSEKRTIKVKHKASGREKEFNTRTDFYGKQKKVVGGWLKDRNTNRETEALAAGKSFVPWTRDDFEITDVQTAQPVENCLHLLKLKINAVLEHLGSENGLGVLGGDNNFRLALPTPEIYKGNREDSLRPLLLKDAREYVQKKYGAKVIDGIEADDYLSMLQQKGYDHYVATGKFNYMVVSMDKDQVQVPGLLFNLMRDKEGWMHPVPWLIDDSMGEIWMSGGKVKGWGKKFFGYQMLFGDSTDNVKPYQTFDVKFGETAAFKIISPCQDEKEMWTAIVNQYKEWFPDGVQFTDHMGIERNFSAGQWASVIFQLVYMKRSPEDKTTLGSVLRSVGVV